MKKYYYDENFFESIDSEAKAYFLGLLFADGYINNKLNYVELTLLFEDIDILNNFFYVLKSNRIPLIINKKTGFYGRVVINSKKIVEDLINHGCLNNKTHTLKFPENLNENLIHHFIRGYFDGDGCIWYNKENQFNIQFDGNYDFINEISNILNKELFIKTKNLTKRHKSRIDNIVVLKYGGNCLVEKIYKFLYMDANLYIKRKKNKFGLVECKKNNTIKYNNVEYSRHNITDLYVILENLVGLERKKIQNRLMNGWSVDDIVLYGKNDKNKITIYKYDINNNLIDVYKSISLAGKMNNLNPDMISKNAKLNKNYKNYYWRFKNE